MLFLWDLCLILRKNFLMLRELDAQWGCGVCLWIHSKPTWTCFCVTCSRWPCLARGLEQVISRGPFQPWQFCDLVKTQQKRHVLSFEKCWVLLAQAMLFKQKERILASSGAVGR